MVAEELRQLTSRAIAFHQPDIWESCDRPQLPNRFNVRNIIPPRDRLDDATIGQTTRLSIEDVRNLRSQIDFFANNNHNCKAPDTLAFLTLEIRIKDPDFTAILGFHS